MSEEKNIPQEEIPQEQPVNKEPANETISSAEPITESETQPSTLNIQPSTEEDMEVHHHSHESHGNPPAGRAGKNWKSYFWEFLMLFLAVFCGFLAEYQLEHKIEKDREKQFMQSLVEDLKSDIVSITSLNQWRDTRLEMSDSLTNALIENNQLQNGSAVYYWGRSISRRGVFFSAEGTIQQLKNSGGLRLIRKQSIADIIIAYDVLY
ncbi:MAG: hypothetical protein LH473_00160, partial [Chitinophagales bacterium]|nr:hypothetical protein [Chitinophagales bacterium]